MGLDNKKNRAQVTVSTGYDASATSIVLTTGHGAKLATPPFNATWWNATDYPEPADDPNVEDIRVTAIATDTLTVTRAQEGTSASTKNAAGKTYKIRAGMTAKDFNTDIPALFSASLDIIPASNNTYVLGTGSKAWAQCVIANGGSVLIQDAYLQRRMTGAFRVTDGNGDAGPGFESLFAKNAILTKTSAYTATAYDHTILVDASGGAVTITLPAPSQTTDANLSQHASQLFIVKKIDSSGNAVTVQVSGGSNIDGASTSVLSSQWSGKHYKCNGTQYYIVGSF